MNDHIWHYDAGEPEEYGIAEELYDSYRCRDDAINAALEDGLQTFTLFTARHPTEEDIEEHLEAALYSVADEDATQRIQESMVDSGWWCNWEEPLDDRFDFDFLGMVHAAIRSIVIRAMKQGFTILTGHREVFHLGQTMIDGDDDDTE